MAKKKKKNSDGYDGDSYDDDGQLSLDEQLFNEDQRHYRQTEEYVRRAEQLYNLAIKDLAELATQVGIIPPAESFSFDLNPAVLAKVQQTIMSLASRISAVIDSGCREEWDRACIKSDKFLDRIRQTSGLTEEQITRYQDRNLEALAAFQERKVEGLNLSERVWKMVHPLKQEVELVVDTTPQYYDHGVGMNTKESIGKVQRGIGKGTSAAELSREIRGCLQEPNKLFRRVKDKYGNLTLSKAAKLYHPGQGVYRSSYKNAMRVTRSEINMAYRQSDSMRWQQTDFVVGIEVNLSNNHTTPDPKSKGRLKLVDICDELKGKYPKDFKFVGWHPQCRCFVTPILKTREELMRDRMNIDDPDYVSPPSENEVTDVPAGFKQYVQDNDERIQGWSSTPYYIKDNPQYYDKALNPEKYQSQGLTLSDDQSKAITDFQAYANNHQGSKKFASALDRALKARLAGDLDTFEAAMKEMAKIQKTNEGVAEYLRKKKNRELYDKLKDDPDYSRVEYDEDSGGVLAIHKGHTTHSNDKKTYFYPENITGDELEKECYESLFKTGHSVILCDESKTYIDNDGQEQYYSALDMILDGVRMDIKSVTENRFYGNQLKAKHSQIKKYIERPDTTDVPDSVMLYFHDPSYFEESKLIDKSIPHYKERVHHQRIKNIYVKLKGIDEIQVYHINENWEVSKTSLSTIQTKVRPVHDAKVSNNTDNSKVNSGNNEDKGSKTHKTASARAKSPKERRHEWDDRIAVLKAKASKYHLDTEAINRAYTSLDLQKLEQTVSSQEQLLARRAKNYAIAEKRHQQRTQADIDRMQTSWNMRRIRSYGYERYIDQIDDLVMTHGVDRTHLEEFLKSKQSSDRTRFVTKIWDLDDKYDKLKEQAITRSIDKKNELLMIKQKLLEEGGSKAKIQVARIEKYIRQVSRLKDSVAFFNGEKFQNSINNMNRRLKEISEHREEVRKAAEEWSKKRTRPTKLNKTLENCKNKGIRHLEVKPYEKEMTDEDIIARVGGGDLTQGSCSSLAFCFAGNKAGLDVIDFRDGDSRKFFATNGNIYEIARSVGGIIETNKSDIQGSKILWQKMEVGKYYYFCTGRHAAVIRKRTITIDGKEKEILEYLELQSSRSNGFKPLDTKVLRSRFAAKSTHTFYGIKLDGQSVLIDFELLQKDTGFRKMLGYINTEDGKQVKGKSGSVK